MLKLNLFNVSRRSTGKPNILTFLGRTVGMMVKQLCLEMLTRGIYFNQGIKFCENHFLPCFHCCLFYPDGYQKVGFRFGPAERGEYLVYLFKPGFLLFECRKPNYTLVNSLQSTKHRKKQWQNLKGQKREKSS